MRLILSELKEALSILGRDPNQDMPMVTQIKDEVRKLNTKEIIWTKIKDLEAKLDFEYNKKRFIGDENNEVVESIKSDNQSKKSAQESKPTKQEEEKFHTNDTKSKKVKKIEKKEIKANKVNPKKEPKESPKSDENYGFLSRLVNDVENENKPQSNDTPSSDYQTPTKSKYSLHNSRDNFIDTIYEESQETF
jgi:outer membrane biosynthesis protein TonB